jgi:hypothetical protein
MVAVVARARFSALRAATSAPHRSNVNDESFVIEFHVEHTGPFQTQQGTE